MTKRTNKPADIESVAKANKVLTIAMLAEALELNPQTVRGRLEKVGAKPVAKIHPAGRGRATPAYAQATLEQIRNIGGEARIEMLGSGDR